MLTLINSGYCCIQPYRFMVNLISGYNIYTGFELLSIIVDQYQQNDQSERFI